ncbi:hypothetical protein WJX72_004699 [[Myrmecia] bisecta]|uniref:Uncharacterized protein n=1 Tax=[Myrmecia] bisecta TaxID=41462 RepID=A0AAW1Q4N3_9CHLO
MAAINVTAVQVLDNPSLFGNPLQFDIQYECVYDLQDDLEWKLIYVGSAESEKYDQVLDSVLVGPVAPGNYRFVFQADAPDQSKLPPEDVVGVTLILLTCSYRGKEFIRVGYYVNNEYYDEELRESPPENPMFDRLVRNILADKPRVTKFPVEFDPVDVPQQQGGSMDTSVPAEGFAPAPGTSGCAAASAGPESGYQQAVAGQDPMHAAYQPADALYPAGDGDDMED